MKTIMKEFKEFALKGNVLDMAIGVIMGGAFGKIVSSLVNDIFMPLIGLATGGVSVSDAFIALDGGKYATLDAAKEAGAATLNYGMFVQNIIDFVCIAVCIFLFVKAINSFKTKKAETPAEEPILCPYCRQAIAKDAKRCPHCTSELE